MKDKDVVIVAIGLVAILCVVGLIVWGNSEFTNSSTKAMNASDSLISQQKDMEIKKLAKQLKAKQAELDNIKKELVNSDAKIKNIKADLSSTGTAAAR